MASKSKGDLRKRLVRGDRRASSAESETDHGRLASELGESVGRTVETATALGLAVAEDAVLKLMELFAPSKPTSATRAMGAAASMLTSTRTTAPKMTGQVANRVTEAMVNGGFTVLGGLHRAVGTPRRPR